jgi:hypothetical protein
LKPARYHGGSEKPVRRDGSALKRLLLHIPRHSDPWGWSKTVTNRPTPCRAVLTKSVLKHLLLQIPRHSDPWGWSRTAQGLVAEPGGNEQPQTPPSGFRFARRGFVPEPWGKEQPQTQLNLLDFVCSRAVALLRTCLMTPWLSTLGAKVLTRYHLQNHCMRILLHLFLVFGPRFCHLRGSNLTSKLA